MGKLVEMRCEIYKRKKTGKRITSKYDRTMNGFVFLHCDDGLDKINVFDIRLVPSDSNKSLFKLSRDDILMIKNYKIIKVTEINLCNKRRNNE